MLAPIHDDVPLPRGGARPQKYPWRNLEVGQSFLAAALPGTVRGQASRMGKVLGRRFTVRVVDGLVRVWRVG